MNSICRKFEPSSTFHSSATVDTHGQLRRSYKPKGWAKNSLSPNKYPAEEKITEVEMETEKSLINLLNMLSGI
jgi:hypothetical protein